jgi:magnesium chelatase family protein
LLAKVLSCAIVGLDAQIVEVEVDITRGAPFFSIVGLPDAAVRESKDRVFAAVRNSGFKFPANRRITVNLAPADLRKEGPSYDLPIALGVLAATQQVWPQKMEKSLIVGELALDGALRHTKGVLPMAALARANDIGQVVVPAVNAEEAALIPDLEVIGAEQLSQLVNHLTGVVLIDPCEIDLSGSLTEGLDYAADFADIMGQEHVKRAMEVSSAGGHNAMTCGTIATYGAVRTTP